MNKQNIYWQLYQDDPILKPGFPSPVLADPSFLFGRIKFLTQHR
ncbi:hypothetical protein LEP1GSC199_2894 [Leptospira vanthielii serovar Holland str. Waz Holland = ATCC 700522]|uniref:Uncharacterized protein n=1 Tax=Leptospira vanthielii serovar Holland str. Waz Holland = ATCC 700522 TaxID=1218591 RepID=N1W766_9LEPT|nr:hypothetical protein LEP1GSC199_2894 [Leptospira vanthielii serovar Holland str. Waz Holland = ATCC 700522]